MSTTAAFQTALADAINAGLDLHLSALAARDPSSLRDRPYQGELRDLVAALHALPVLSHASQLKGGHRGSYLLSTLCISLAASLTAMDALIHGYAGAATWGRCPAGSATDLWLNAGAAREALMVCVVGTARAILTGLRAEARFVPVFAHALDMSTSDTEQAEAEDRRAAAELPWMELVRHHGAY